MVRVGLISDTHGLLRPEAVAALGGSDVIIHAGDVGNAEVLAALRRIAPLTVVRGNNDDGEWARRLPLTAHVEIASVRFFVIHDLATLALDPASARIDVVVSGHSHVPKCETRNAVLYVNPGSAGPRRFRLPTSVAEVRVAGSRVETAIVELEIGSSGHRPGCRVAKP
jgi:uncharacterized protein